MDGKVEQRAVAELIFAIQLEPDRPNLFRLERALGPELPSGIPYPLSLEARIVNRVSHDKNLPSATIGHGVRSVPTERPKEL
jgi:hypothetical protein